MRRIIYTLCLLVQSCHPGALTVADGGTEDVAAVTCKKHAECASGLCVNDMCCATKARSCGEVCCDDRQICLNNQCVSYGRDCFASSECEAGHYCETHLDDRAAADATTATAINPACVQPKPTIGACLPLPPVCKDEADAAQGNCVLTCEYRPKAKKLDAVVKWQWGKNNVIAEKSKIDVWSTPAVARVTDTNCDGKVDGLDPPNVIFISGDAAGNQCIAANSCRTGVLRVLDGQSGKEVWSLASASSVLSGFSGVSVAVGDLNRDKKLDIVAVSGDGHLVAVDHQGKLLAQSDQIIPGSDHNQFGWGGGLAIADMNGDGNVEIAYGPSVFTYSADKITFQFAGTKGKGGAINRALSFFADLNNDGVLELVAGNAAYKWPKGDVLWFTSQIGDGYGAVADFNQDKKPEVAYVAAGTLRILNGQNGTVLAGPLSLPGSKPDGTISGGPPTIADFDGDKKPEVGVAMAQYYVAITVDFAATPKLSILWQQANHDLSSSVTGSTVFDFEGDGSAEVIYNDECFLWVYDGKTGAVRFATPTTSFTATESSLVADIDGDDHAEIIMIANGIDTSKWHCNELPWTKADPKNNRPAWAPPTGEKAYRGVMLWGDRANSWVGTRPLWNQHTYHVSNICDGKSSACTETDNHYGEIPKRQISPWKLPWLNSFRQNIQEAGIFNAPDAVVSLRVSCSAPVSLIATVRNVGQAILPAGVVVEFFSIKADQSKQRVGIAKTETLLLSGQATSVTLSGTAASNISASQTYIAQIADAKQNGHFTECRTTNNASSPAKNECSFE